MTQPDEVAANAEHVADGLWHWRINNAGIGGAISSSHAVSGGAGCTLIDPVRLEPAALASLPQPAAIALTATCHQRAAWSYRDELGIEVWLPEDARPGDAEPDRCYTEGDVLPGGLLAFRTPGPEKTHYSFLLEREPGVLFCSDLLMNDGGRELAFVPPEFHEDPDETRRSVEKLLDLPFAILCLAHGRPVVDDPKTVIRELLDATG